MIDSARLTEFAHSRGVDLVGVAPISRLAYLPPQENPLSIFPYAESVVVLGFRIPRGSLRGIEEGTYWAGYNFMGYGTMNKVTMMQGLRDVTLWLEDQGWEGVPYPHYYPGGLRGGTAGEPVGDNRTGPDVWLNFRAAAAAAGLGELGYSKVFLTPQYGPRQRFSLIITDAPLTPTPMFTGSVCDHCMLCVKSCPAGAISGSETISVSIGGREFTWGRLDVAKCLLCHHGALREASPFLREQPSLPDIEAEDDWDSFDKAMAVARDVAKQVPYYKGLLGDFPGHWAICGAKGCIRTCLDHLERVGAIEARFHNPFRRHGVWQR